MKFRIREIPDLGFIPERYDDLVEDWATIKQDLTLGVFSGSVAGKTNHKHFHKTAEKAGLHINKYCAVIDAPTVWSN